jgi:hypothetical protein
MPAWTRLIGAEDVDKKSFLENLEENLIEFFNWGLLEGGGYSDAHIDTPGVSDPTDDVTLLPNHMQGVVDGRIWQSPHRGWVWESGLESARQPIPVSGVYINGDFVQTPASGTQYEHYINYPAGRVIFANPIPTNTVVQAEYSFRWVHFYNQDVPWFRDVIFDAYRYETGPDVPVSGVIGLLDNYAVELPAVVIETVATRRFVPKQQGDLSQWIYQDFLFHILTDNSPDRSGLIDYISLQKDKTIYLFDRNAQIAANKLPLDWRGSPVSGAMTYPMLVEPPPSGYQYNKCRFSNMVGQESSARLPLFRAIIRATLQVDFPG